MVNMLFSLYNFHESFAKDSVGKYISAGKKVMIIPFSFGSEISNEEDFEYLYCNNGEWYKEIVSIFKSFEIKEENIKWVNYFKDTKEKAKDLIKDSDIIFLTWGFPEKMMARLIEFDLVNDIENFKGVIMGSSAGAMAQISEYHITPDADYDTFSYNLGLNIINDFGIEVHYAGTEVQNKHINKVLKEKKEKIYAITNGGGIIVDNGEIILLGDTKIFTRNN